MISIKSFLVATSNSSKLYSSSLRILLRLRDRVTKGYNVLDEQIPNKVSESKTFFAEMNFINSQLEAV